jgi:hypothetical protein
VSRVITQNIFIKEQMKVSCVRHRMAQNNIAARQHELTMYETTYVINKILELTHICIRLQNSGKINIARKKNNFLQLFNISDSNNNKSRPGAMVRAASLSHWVTGSKQLHRNKACLGLSLL